MDDSKIYVEQFIEIIKDKYPKLYVDYDYNLELDLIEIWHNDSDLQFNNHDFLCFAGKTIKDILFKNDIYNFYFGYDYNNAEVISNYNLLNVVDNQLAFSSLETIQLNQFKINIDNKKADNTSSQPDVKVSETQKITKYVHSYLPNKISITKNANIKNAA